MHEDSTCLRYAGDINNLNLVQILTGGDRQITGYISHHYPHIAIELREQTRRELLGIVALGKCQPNLALDVIAKTSMYLPTQQEKEPQYRYGAVRRVVDREKRKTCLEPPTKSEYLGNVDECAKENVGYNRQLKKRKVKD